MKFAPQIVRAQDVAPRPWRNGGGQTRELFTWPADSTPAAAPPAATPWQLRISLAEVSSSGPFSAYPGVQRWFTVVDGAGVRLTLDGVKHHLDAGSAPLHFAGEAAVHCEPVAGPTRDLNLMCSGGTALVLPCRSHACWTSPLTQRGLFTRCAGRWHIAGGLAMELPAHTLLWLIDAAGLDFFFEAPSRNHRGPAGWWLGYTPG